MRLLRRVSCIQPFLQVFCCVCLALVSTHVIFPTGFNSRHIFHIFPLNDLNERSFLVAAKFPLLAAFEGGSALDIVLHVITCRGLPFTMLHHVSTSAQARRITLATPSERDRPKAWVRSHGHRASTPLQVRPKVPPSMGLVHHDLLACSVAWMLLCCNALRASTNGNDKSHVRVC